MRGVLNTIAPKRPFVVLTGKLTTWPLLDAQFMCISTGVEAIRLQTKDETHETFQETHHDKRAVAAPVMLGTALAAAMVGIGRRKLIGRA